MPIATLTRPTESGTRGSTTVTQTSIPSNPRLNLSTPAGTLRLRGEPTQSRRIRWAEDVVDNENLGRKSSKVCCIYHKPRAIDESSDDDSSSSGSDSGSEPDDSKARMGGKGKARRTGPHHDHKDGDDGCSQAASGNNTTEKRSKNAYEKMPKNKGSEQKI